MVVFLDFRRRTCMRRVLRRRLLDRHRSRPDLPAGAREGLDPALLRWIWDYPRDDRPKVLALLAKLGPNTKVEHLQGPSEVQRLLDRL
jgi:hypothetical protein